jgi:hypothetical protein
MSDQTTLTELEENERVELVAEFGERLRRGETIRPADYPRKTDTLRELMSTLKMSKPDIHKLPTNSTVGAIDQRIRFRSGLSLAESRRPSRVTDHFACEVGRFVLSKRRRAAG